MINQGAVETRVESVDFKEYLAVLLKRKWLILICLLLSMAGTMAFLFTRQPVWRASTKLLVTKWGGSIPVSDVTHEDDRSFYETQIRIMSSGALQRRVQDRLSRTSQDVGENLQSCQVDRLGGAEIIVISVDSISREFAREYANAVAEEYMKYRDEQRALGSETALLLLTREINRLSQELKSATQRVVTYEKDHNITGGGYGPSHASQVLSTLTQAAGVLADDQIRLQVLAARPDVASALTVLGGEMGANVADQLPPLNDAGQPEKGSSSPSDSTNATTDAKEVAPASQIAYQGPVIRQPLSSGDPLWVLGPSQASLLRGQDLRRRSLEARLTDLLRIYKPKHPAIQQIQNELEQIKNNIDLEVTLVRDQAEAAVKMAQARFDRIKAQYDSMNKISLENIVQGNELRALRDDESRIQGLYNMLLGQLMKVDMSQNFNERTISILEPAVVQGEPIYPKKLKGLFMAAFLGLGLGLALAFFIEYIDDSIKLAEEVERDLQLPFLGIIPAAQWNPDDLSAHRLDRVKQQGGVSEAYRVVRSAIIFSTPREKLRTILFTSAVPREGKTTTCVNLSIGFAQIEDNVLLVDGDLRRGEVHKYFNLDKDKGLSDVLLGEATPDEVIKKTDVPKLDVVTCGAHPTNPAELLLGWRLKEFLDWAQKHYSRVIIDCTPVMGIADSAILGAVVDGVMFVIWAGRTSRRYVRVAKMTAVSRGAKIFGFVLNNLEPGRVGYYHYYPYYYSYYTRGYYYSRTEEPGVPAAPSTDPSAVNGQVPASESEDTKIDDVY